MTIDEYTSDDALNASPPPQKQNPDYGIHKSPPPFISEKNEGSFGKRSPSDSSYNRPNRYRKSAKASMRDQLILSSLAPNRPDLIYHQTPLDPASDTSDDGGGPSPQKVFQRQDKRQDNSTSGAKTTARGALKILKSDQNFLEAPKPPIDSKPQHVPPIQDNPKEKNSEKLLPSVSQIFSNPNPKSPHITSNFPEARPITTSLGLREYSILPSGGPVAETLPALQSPPQSTSGSSPDAGQSLPSFKATFSSDISDVLLKDSSGRTGATPTTYPMVTSQPHPCNRMETHARRPSDQYLTPYIPTTPYSHVSPAKPKEVADLSASSISSNAHQTYWPGPLTNESPHSQSSCEPSSHYGDSPGTGYPTPTEPGRQDDGDGGIFSHDHVNIHTSVDSNGLFKCTFTGCKAQPFQTQYLLNSHANVHSQLRPYYCPVQNCLRGEGGKGFKRKNEMIRHGLVHDSPGYVCPFCPDQRHRYPRPDNLQRHVRVHHVDKDKEDPLLREVLAQRPEGANRGRRRRA